MFGTHFLSVFTSHTQHSWSVKCMHCSSCHLCDGLLNDLTNTLELNQFTDRQITVVRQTTDDKSWFMDHWQDDNGYLAYWIWRHIEDQLLGKIQQVVLSGTANLAPRPTTQCCYLVNDQRAVAGLFWKFDYDNFELCIPDTTLLHCHKSQWYVVGDGERTRQTDRYKQTGRETDQPATVASAGAGAFSPSQSVVCIINTPFIRYQKGKCTSKLEPNEKLYSP